MIREALRHQASVLLRRIHDVSWRSLPAICGAIMALGLAPGIQTVLHAQTALSGPDARPGEVVANLAAGRVVLCVAKDALIVAAVGGGGEAGSRIPAIVPLPAQRIGVLLGAVEWATPDSKAAATRLDAELANVAGASIKRPRQSGSPDQMNDIEQIGIGMLEELRPFVTQIHHKLDLKPDEPLVEMLITDYVENYGFEIWSLQYRVRQEPLANDFWQTRILRPAYNQLFPPEKGQPKTFVEVRYPATSSGPTLAQRLGQHDPQIETMRGASPELAKATDAILAGDSTKAAPRPIADFLRAVLPSGPPRGPASEMTLALLDGAHGFQWLIPPAEPLPPPSSQEAEPGAPSLRNRRPR